MSEIIAAVVVTLLTAAVGFFAWTLRRLVLDVGKIKIDMAVVKAVIVNAGADHDKLIEARKDIENIMRDLNAGFRAMRARLGEIDGKQDRDKRVS